MQLNSKIYVAGHNGLVGSAIVRLLRSKGFNNLVTKSSLELDLRNQKAVDEFFAQERPDFVFLAAAKVGGIKANAEYPAEFIYDNIMINTNVIHESYKYGVKRLLFLGSSCIYPRDSIQPIKEEYLMTGPLEPTNDAYAIAKIAGLRMCKAYNQQYGTHFISCMPTNLYGPNDNFDLETSHVLPALIAKFTKAKEENVTGVVVWGTGKPMREFLFVDDLADACFYLMQTYNGFDPINIGTGEEISIAELALMIKDLVGYKGDIFFDDQHPDGAPRKLLDVSKINQLGWTAQTSLKDGLKQTIEWFDSKVCLPNSSKILKKSLGLLLLFGMSFFSTFCDEIKDDAKKSEKKKEISNKVWPDHVDSERFGGMSIPKEVFDFIRNNLKDGETLLEFGSGWASSQMSKYYNLYSVEHNPLYVGMYETKYIYAPIKNGWYDVEVVTKELPKDYKMILVDGPPGNIGRGGFLKNLSLFNTNVIIILDDVQREAEARLASSIGLVLNRKVEIFECPSDLGNKKFAVIRP
ncbi:MAG: GDP-fucose synthetase [candidate division TM6 bacterium GW2011_GWF2_32_72]|nr:MAG: GDP-fucose synthetase [candidate division TM6 bacterium GW2011_GWF2_32_72]